MKNLLQAGALALALLSCAVPSAPALAQNQTPGNNPGCMAVANGGCIPGEVVILPQVSAATAYSGQFGTSATQLMPANPTRRFMVIQNQSSSADCYIRGGGVTATADYNSLKIAAGAYYETTTHVGTGAISIICTGASTSVYASAA